MALERLEEVQPLECMGNFSSLQESNQSALLGCASSLVDTSLLIGNMCNGESLSSNAHMGGPVGIQRSGTPIHGNVSHTYENSCTYQLKDSDISMMKPFFATDLPDHDVSLKDDLNRMEQLGIISAPCNLSSPTSSVQMVNRRAAAATPIQNDSEMQENCGEESMLLKLGEEFCYSDGDLCRLCANKGFCLLSLFHGEGLKLNLLEKIHRCLPIKVSDADGLPTQVCGDCTTKLQICDDLIRTSITAHGKLQAIKSIKAESLCLLDAETLRQHTKETEDKVEEKIFEDPDSNDVDNIVALKEVTDKNLKISNNAERELMCSKCDFKAKQETSLIFHVQQNHCPDLEASFIKRDTEESSVKKDIPKIFTCDYCDKSFQSKLKWQRHELSHTKLAMQQSEVYKSCGMCEQKFISTRELKDHYKTVHDEKGPRIYSCDQCDKSYKIAGSLDIHRATHSKETPYLCDLCGKSFKHVSNLRSHKRSHSGDGVKRRHACDLCHKAFTSKFHLSEHRNVHLNITPYSCAVCDKKFHRRTQLRQHKAIHTIDNSFECPHCGACFNRRGNMTQHMKRHTGDKKFICRICKASFQTLSEVVQHRRNHSPQELMNQLKEKGLHSCEQCSKVFPSLHRLEEHVKTHCGLKFECSLCNKKLSNRRTLEYHMRSFHTGERPHVCQFCTEKFLSKEARIVHERLHTGEKPFSCSICGMGFRCSSNLNQHLSTHQEDRPWVCDQCPKRFKRKGILLVHMRTHTGDKPFCCDQCGRRFTQKNDMLKHQLTHKSPEQSFLCSSCNWRFDSAGDLHSHILTQHALIEVSLEENRTPSSQSQVEEAVVAADAMAQFPLAVMENVSNIIVTQMGPGSHPQDLQVDLRQPNTGILHVTDPIFHSVVPEPQVLLQSSGEPHLIQFGEDTVVLQTSQNTLLP